jgi:NAD(P)-dependent dehydrogenase (short-subunit alcohol dehydrogenase family)
VLVPVDLVDTRATDDALKDLTARFRFDGVINNVGLVRPQRLDAVELTVLDEVLRANLHPALQMVQALLPGMTERRWGRIVNISSLTVLGSVERTAYAAAKAALVSFSRSWALELATTGITVNAVSPGPTETELFRANNPPGSDGERRYLSSVPMTRASASLTKSPPRSPSSYPDAGFITGQTLHVDGGASIGKAAF